MIRPTGLPKPGLGRRLSTALFTLALATAVGCASGDLDVPQNFVGSSAPPVHMSFREMHTLPLCSVLAPQLRGRPGIVYQVVDSGGLYAIGLEEGGDIVCVDDESGVLECGMVLVSGMAGSVDDCDGCDGTPLPAITHPGL